MNNSQKIVATIFGVGLAGVAGYAGWAYFDKKSKTPPAIKGFPGGEYVGGYPGGEYVGAVPASVGAIMPSSLPVPASWQGKCSPIAMDVLLWGSVGAVGCYLLSPSKKRRKRK